MNNALSFLAVAVGILIVIYIIAVVVNLSVMLYGARQLGKAYSYKPFGQLAPRGEYRQA